MGYACREAPVRAGHRIPFGFYRHGAGTLRYFVGPAADFDVRPADQTAAMLFWPMLSGPASVVTGTGNFQILIGTTITTGELELAKQTTTVHLLLLLWLSGVRQRTIFGRQSVTADPRWAAEWNRIAGMSHQDANSELRRISRDWLKTSRPTGP
jgi:hypothetical protein